MLKRVKRAVLKTLDTVGVFHAISHSDWRRQRLAILCYHGVSLDDEHLWDPYLYMKPSDIEARFARIREGGYSVLPLNEAIERLYQGDLPEKSAALTFDDGFHDFYCQAYPLLRKYELPATVYLTTYYCDDNRAVFNVALSYVLWKGRASRQDLATPAGRQQAWDAIKDRAERDNLNARDKDTLLQEIAAGLGIDYAGIQRRRILHLMTPAEVAELAAAGIDVQLHTHRHRTPLDRALFTREIADNRARIAGITGTRATHFCYPSGVYRPEFLPWLEEQEVASATTCDVGLASLGHHRLLLPRIVDHSRFAPIEFDAWLTGAAHLLPNKRTLVSA
jgi:peptidoglycan/xylan/chitin deacetylase (PgdA/CDA1 family)